MMGRELARLVNQVVEVGTHVVSCDASDLPCGVYCYRLHANGSMETRKAVVLK